MKKISLTIICVITCIVLLMPNSVNAKGFGFGDNVHVFTLTMETKSALQKFAKQFSYIRENFSKDPIIFEMKVNFSLIELSSFLKTIEYIKVECSENGDVKKYKKIFDISKKMVEIIDDMVLTLDDKFKLLTPLMDEMAEALKY